MQHVVVIRRYVMSDSRRCVRANSRLRQSQNVNVIVVYQVMQDCRLVNNRTNVRATKFKLTGSAG